MWLTRVSINQPVFATMVMVALLVLGIVSYNRLPVEQVPETTPQMAMVLINYPGASPEAAEQELVRPLENAINSVNGINRMMATAREGGAAIWVEFDFDVDAVLATQEMRDRISEVANLLPEDAEAPRVTRAMGDDNAEPIVDLAISSPVRSLRELSDITEQLIVKRLKMVAGVGSVDVRGNVPRQVKVLLKPEKLRSYGIGVDEVVNAIRRANRDLPAGNLRRVDAEKMVRIEGRIKNPDEFGRIIVTTRGGAMYLQQGGLPVHLDQVADIVDGQAEVDSLSRLDGVPSLDVEIIKVQGANIVATADGVLETIDTLKQELPEDIRIDVVQSSADVIRASLDGTRVTIVEGAMLTVLIVFLFLKSWRSTVITGLTLPISVIATFIVVYALGFTLNMVTLMALSLCIGLLIDDAIVVRENIVRHLGMGKSHYDAARDGTDEIGLAVTATTLAIVAVFVPVAFMDGLIGRYFYQFGLTIAVAVMVSLFVSFTLDPMLSSVWHDPPESRFNRLPWLAAILERFNAGVDRTHAVYGRVLAWSLKRDRHRAWIPVFGLFYAIRKRNWRYIGTVSNRGLVMWGALLVFVGSFGLLPFIGSEFMPSEDRGYISMRLEMPVGSSLEYTDAKTRQVEQALRESPYIDKIAAQIGTYEGRNHSRLKIKLVNAHETGRPSQKQLEREYKQRVKQIAGVESRIGWRGSMSITMLGPDQSRLAALSHDVKDAIEQIPGVSSVNTTEKGTSPTIAVKLDRELANDLGLDVERVGRALRILVAGDKITDWLAPDGQNYDVMVQLPPDQRGRREDLGGLYLSTSRLDADGLPVLVPLRQIATLEETTAPDSIRRMNMQRRVSLMVSTQGRPPGDVGRDVMALIKNFEMPRGYRFDVSGEQEYLTQTVDAAVAAMAIAIIFIYLILASQFGSFVQPVAIMASLPLSFVGAFLALLITGSTLNMLSMIGLILLMGLVTKNAILLVDFCNQGLRSGLDLNTALMEAGQVRLRPILMTSMAMIFGMLPMAAGLNPAGEFYSPMARAVIGGVITSTLLTLVVVPVLCTFLYSFSDRVRARLTRKAAAGDTAGVNP